MATHIQKSVRECLSKIKISNKQIHFRFRSCQHTRTQSFDFDAKRDDPDDAVTLSDIDPFLFENFRSLYHEERGNRPKPSSFLPDSPRFLDPPTPEDLRRSGRFFVDSGSSSSLITEDACSSSADDFIVVFTNSLSPYEDFRRSMQEMLEAHVEQSGKVDWEYMEELLFCYLDLNEKKSYRYILHAFVDLIVVLREREFTQDPTDSTIESVEGCKE